MSTYKNLGGDRLGSGNKIKVELHGYERSTHDLSYVWRNTQAPGTLVPFLCEVALPGDTFDIDLEAAVRTHPTVGPLFGSFKLQLDVFSCPIRLYNKTLHNNKLGVGMNIASIKFPLLQVAGLEIVPESETIPPPDMQHVNPSALLAYLGFKGLAGNMDGSTAGITGTINAIPLLAYWDIFKNYYANKMETNAYVIHAALLTVTSGLMTQAGGTVDLSAETSDPIAANDYIIFTGTGLTPKGIYLNLVDIGGTNHISHPVDYFTTNIEVSDDATTLKMQFPEWIGTMWSGWKVEGYTAVPGLATDGIKPILQAFPLANIDTMRDNILAASAASAYTISPATNLAPYDTAIDIVSSTYKMFATYPQEGLAVKTYQSDLFNNWLNSEFISGASGIATITAISTAAGSFTIDQLNLSKKVYDMLNRVAISGASYEDWLEATYSHQSRWRAESPIYLGGLSKEIVFQEVVSTVESTKEDPLGSLAGKGVLSDKHKGGYVVAKIDEPSYIIGIVSITPRIDYSQGNEWHTNLKTMDDLHKPALDQIGFQDLVTEQMAFWDNEVKSGVLTKYAAGKQPAWLNYMTNFNKCFGNFADSRNEMYMTLNRRYKMNTVTKRISDLTTYIDPSKFNYAFAQTDISAMNFWVQLRVGQTARRKMSAKIIPNL